MLMACMSCTTVCCCIAAEYVTCSSVATVLDLNEQQVQLLIDTLAAVGGSSSVQQEGLEPRVNLHELSLFLLAQIYGREAHRCVAGHGSKELSTAAAAGGYRFAAFHAVPPRADLWWPLGLPTYVNI